MPGSQRQLSVPAREVQWYNYHVPKDSNTVFVEALSKLRTYQMIINYQNQMWYLACLKQLLLLLAHFLLKVCSLSLSKVPIPGMQSLERGRSTGPFSARHFATLAHFALSGTLCRPCCDGWDTWDTWDCDSRSCIACGSIIRWPLFTGCQVWPEIQQTTRLKMKRVNIIMPCRSMHNENTCKWLATETFSLNCCVRRWLHDDFGVIWPHSRLSNGWVSAHSSSGKVLLPYSVIPVSRIKKLAEKKAVSAAGMRQRCHKQNLPKDNENSASYQSAKPRG